MRGLTASHMIVDEFYDERTGEPNDEAIMKTKVHFNQQTKEWFIPKGTTGKAWMDSPLKDRVMIEIKTTHDISAYQHVHPDVDGYEAWHSTKEYLIILKRTKGEPMWFLSIEKDHLKWFMLRKV